VASFDAPERLLFTQNESNPRLWGRADAPGHYKDAFHEFLVHGREGAVSPASDGTKAAALHALDVPAGGSARVRVRLAGGTAPVRPFDDFDQVFALRRAEADRFYDDLHGRLAGEEERRVQRQALAGMIWSQQVYLYDIPSWLDGDPLPPRPPAGRRRGRNADWRHLHAADILSMPDKWEYPWFAAWDLAFHCVPLALVDPAFAKQQLVLLCRERYMHPNGQLPAYEWAFGDVNPPVHAWAAWRVFQMDRQRTGGDGDLDFLERVLHKLLLNFTWWVNRKDAHGRNIFQGGFLGLDNIGVFDRSQELPTGGHLNQADGTAWMAMYSLNLMRIALELARHDHVYEDIASKFFEHFLHIAKSITNLGGADIGLWDDEDNFYYDELELPDGRIVPLKVRSMVGLVPLFAVEILDEELLAQVPGFVERMDWFLRSRPDLTDLVSRFGERGEERRHLLSLARRFRMKRVLERVLDEGEFLSAHGVRSLSRVHAERPFVFEHDGGRHEVAYLPAESDSGLFGGNSNWRGPVWWPVNYLLIESLRRFHRYYGDEFRIAYPTGSDRLLTLREVADELAGRLLGLFMPDDRGRRPVFGDSATLQTDPHFKDHLLFYEYFHGDNGRGVGASHQTGWTGLAAKLIDDRRPRAG
ncbi:MAG TPA: glucosidase, partial [Arenibaculum sp.]|nr:glucosidase [Arenibaculum sp.]